MTGPGGHRQDLVVVDGIDVWLGGRQVLREVSFGVAAGELTAMIGSNGAGKTTLFRAMTGQLRPSAGQVLVAGRPLSRRNRSIGYVPQRVVVDPDMPLRARDLVALGLDGHRFGLPLPSAARRRAADEMLDAVEGGSFADRRVGQLSGGELQRVLIAHALIRRPQLLLLDEPLAGLDLASEQEVVALLATIVRDRDVGVLISAHDINPLLPVIDRVVYIAGGRAASGTAAEVVRTEVLSALYGHPVTVIEAEGRVIVVAGPGRPTTGDGMGRGGR